MSPTGERGVPSAWRSLPLAQPHPPFHPFLLLSLHECGIGTEIMHWQCHTFWPRDGARLPSHAHRGSVTQPLPLLVHSGLCSSSCPFLLLLLLILYTNWCYWNGGSRFAVLFFYFFEGLHDVKF